MAVRGRRLSVGRRRDARKSRLGPPARRDGEARAAFEGRRPRRRPRRRGPRAGRDHRRWARPLARSTRTKGDIGRRPARCPRLEPRSRARAARRGRADRDRHDGRRPVVVRAPRPAPQGDRLPRPRHRPPACFPHRQGRTLARDAALSLPFRRARKRHLLPAPDPPPRGAGEDPAPVGVAAARCRDPGQGDVLRPDDRGGRRPCSSVDPRRTGRGRPVGAVLAPDPPARGHRARELRSSGTSGGPG